MSNSTSSESDPTTTTSAPGVVERGNYFIAYQHNSIEPTQKKCGSCKNVTQHDYVNLGIWDEEGRASDVRILLCTSCGMTSKSVHFFKSHDDSKPLTESKS